MFGRFTSRAGMTLTRTWTWIRPWAVSIMMKMMFLPDCLHDLLSHPALQKVDELLEDVRRQAYSLRGAGVVSCLQSRKSNNLFQKYNQKNMMKACRHRMRTWSRHDAHLCGQLQEPQGVVRIRLYASGMSLKKIELPSVGVQVHHLLRYLRRLRDDQEQVPPQLWLHLRA